MIVCPQGRRLNVESHEWIAGGGKKCIQSHKHLKATKQTSKCGAPLSPNTEQIIASSTMVSYLKSCDFSVHHLISQQMIRLVYTNQNILVSFAKFYVDWRLWNQILEGMLPYLIQTLLCIPPNLLLKQKPKIKSLTWTSKE